MDQKDFRVFYALLSDVHAKAFGEPLSRLPHGKAQTLSWMVYECTGELLSYKSLSNFVAAALAGTPQAINPTGMTLSILAQFVTGMKASPCRSLAWYEYRSQRLVNLVAA